MTTHENTIVQPIHIEVEDSPLLKVRRRPKRPSLALGGDYTQRLTTNRKIAPRPSGLHSTPPPRFQPLIRTEEVTHPQSLSLNFLQDALHSLPQPEADISRNDGAIYGQDLEHKDLRELATVEISEEESDEYTSSTNEDRPFDPPKITLGPEEGDEQQPDVGQSDDDDVVLEDFLDDADVPDDHPKTTSHEPVRLRFTRYRVKDKDLCSINESIVEIMKNNRKAKTSPGWTYIFESPNRAPGHLKIGSTIRMNERERSLKRCERELVHVKDNDRDAFDFHSIVESLVHQELHNKRRILSCHCGTKHQEWFEVEKDDALKSICRWRTWIKVQKPYDKSWKLTPYWQWKVRNLPKALSHVDWDQWIEPNRLEYYLHFWYDEFGKDYYVVLQKHFERKDKHFWLIGTLLLFFMYLLYGRVCFVWILVGLLLL
jgi:hypothetical protein